MDKYLMAMRVFTGVVECKSFVQTATRMSISTSMVSRMVADLESHLRVRLLQRTTRRLSLTEAGETYYQHCKRLIADIEEVESSIDRDTLRPRGTLRLIVPAAIARTRQWPALLLAYRDAYPDVLLNVSLFNHLLPPAEKGFDVALHVVGPLSNDAVTYPIATLHAAICAAPLYLKKYGTPKTPFDLLQHNCLISTFAPDLTTWRFTSAAKARPINVAVHGNVMSDDGQLLHTLALSGAGILQMMTIETGEDLRKGLLVPILSEWTMPSIPLQAVCPSKHHVSAKARTFIEFIRSHWGDEPPWDLWMTKGKTAKPSSKRRGVR